ncbi:hypothetical protein WICPIJ_005727 [Wickerhamomyces pijperi]|uniref:Uncharacterized protein n=1 Tax=Wickerhamomyces pijperi TaxID=599730 RepID=A0A9P8TLK1_WICPI|nr:hypothetical protein WICPIJ_005727 [Wickerhamomyces pijperi]
MNLIASPLIQPLASMSGTDRNAIRVLRTDLLTFLMECLKNGNNFGTRFLKEYWSLSAAWSLMIFKASGWTHSLDKRSITEPMDADSSSFSFVMQSHSVFKIIETDSLFN